MASPETMTGPTNKILLVGPESTGKTTLAQALAAHFQSPCVPEYTRMYLESKMKAGIPLPVGLIEFGETPAIALGQHILEQCASQSQALLFCDGGVLSTAAYSEYYFGKAAAEVAQLLRVSQYTFALLCAPDLPWMPDPVRDAHADRNAIFQIFRHWLAAAQIPYQVIEGNGTERMLAATRACEQFLNGLP